MKVKITTPLQQEQVQNLCAGDIVEITGIIYTARDAAHKRMLEEYEKTGKFPFKMDDAVIYYGDKTPEKIVDSIIENLNR